MENLTESELFVELTPEEIEQVRGGFQAVNVNEVICHYPWPGCSFPLGIPNPNYWPVDQPIPVDLNALAVNPTVIQ